MLKLINIVKEYGEGENRLEALNNINLDFEKNGMVSILGASGCGKTTLLNIIGGLDKYTSGELLVNGISTKEYKNSDWDFYRNKNIGFVFQSYYLIPHLSVIENVMLAMDLSGINKKEQKKRAMETLDKVGVLNQAKKKPKHLSGGQAQRVAIARAIVNNPDIVLADEPTGALDSENSVQVLSLLKEISKKSLVILVTHNSDLANKYSDRLIKLCDGQIVSDEIINQMGNEEGIERENIIESNKSENKVKKKTTMRADSAFKISIKNLYYKMGRTILTSIAGCIGVVSIALILAFNTGFSSYSKEFEKNSLSKYPITISKSDSKFVDLMAKVAKGDKIDTSVIDMNQILDMLKDKDINLTQYTDEEKIFLEKQISALLDNSDNLFKGNDTSLLKKHIDENFDFSLATIKYDYGINPNVYRIDMDDDKFYGYTKINPYSERIFDSFDAFAPFLGANSSDLLSDKDKDDIIAMMNSLNVWDVMVNDKDVLNSQYDVLAGRLPDNSEEKNGVYEIVLVVDEYNRLTDNMLYALGYIELLNLFTDVINKFLGIGLKNTIKSEYDFNEFIGKEFKLLPKIDYYELNTENGLYDEIIEKKKLENIIQEKALTLRISGIIRTKKDVASGSINGVAGYTESLAKYIINKTNTSQLVIDLQKNYSEYIQKTANKEVVALQEDIKKGKIKVEDLELNQQLLLAEAKNAKMKNLITGEYIDEIKYHALLNQLGAEDLDSPDIIYIYPKSVQSKDSVVSFIENYNKEMRSLYENEKYNTDYSVEYSNELNDIMLSLSSMINTITYILIAITCLAVVVSLFMVGIIMYISVQDRTKEIGILRSMGARNIDIMMIFNSETVLLGLISGIIGIALSYILKYPINAILKSLLGISNLIQPIWWYSLILIGSAVVLTLISGLIPAIVAAKKNPVIALKTE